MSNENLREIFQPLPNIDKTYLLNEDFVLQQGQGFDQSVCWHFSYRKPIDFEVFVLHFLL